MAEEEKRLGRGLGALIGEAMEGEEAGEGGAVRELQLSELTSNPYQPRREFEEGRLSELVESIRENGLLQPLVVRPGEAGYQLVAGERRLRALRELGRESAPVVVRELTDDQMLVLAMVENLQRENLSPLEEASGYRELVQGFGFTQKEVAERVGRDRSTISNTLRLLELPEAVRELLETGGLTAGHGRALLGLDDQDEQIELARQAAEDGLSVRAVERSVRARTRAARREEDREETPSEGGEAPQNGARSAARRVAERAEQALGRVLGTEVKVRLRGETSGEIRIPFHDPDDFQRIMELLAGEEARDVLGSR